MPKPLNGPTGYPFLGSYPSLVWHYSRFLRESQSKYGDVFLVKKSLSDYVVVSNCDFFEFAFKSRSDVFSHREGFLPYFKDLGENSILLQEGKLHLSRKKLIHKKFDAESLGNYFEFANRYIQSVLTFWSSSRSFNLHRAIKESFLDVSSVNFTGCPMSSSLGRINQIFNILISAATTSVSRKNIPFTSFSRALKSKKELSSYFSELIPLRRSSRFNDLLSTLCKSKIDGELLSDEEINEQIVFLISAGHDTVANTITAMACELANNPEWKMRLHNEVSSFSENHLLIENEQKLVVLDAVFDETLRRYPPLSTIPHNATQDFDFKDYSFKKGTLFDFNLFLLHNNPDLWPDPLVWDPNRFLDKKLVEERNRFSFLPFGAGPHTCTGNKLSRLLVKSFFYQFLRRFDFEIVSFNEKNFMKYPMPNAFKKLRIKLIKR